jgi:hypothetical protein
VRWIVVAMIAALGGCDWVLGLRGFGPDARLIDAPPPDVPDAPVFPDCRGHLDFVEIPAAASFRGLSTEYVPTVREDRLEVYQVTGSTGYVIVRSHRDTIDETFLTNVGDTSVINMGTFQDDPALTADGLELAFIAIQSAPVVRGYLTTRPDPMLPGWTAPVPMPGLETTTMKQLDLSPDGLTLYYVTDPSSTLYQATRADRSSPFVPMFMPIASTVHYPTLSANGLELFTELDSLSGVYYATRASTGDVFGAFQAVGALVSAYDVDLVPDGTLLSTGGTHFFQRSCQ